MCFYCCRIKKSITAGPCDVGAMIRPFATSMVFRILSVEGSVLPVLFMFCHSGGLGGEVENSKIPLPASSFAVKPCLVTTG